LLAVGSACLVVGALAAEACFTAPPPDLPKLTDPRPTILNDAVQPPLGPPLYDWPTEFIVPVQIDIPNEPFSYIVFVDFPANQVPALPPQMGPTTAPDGGVSLVTFTLDPPDTPVCPHRVQFLVAAGFDNVSPEHTPDSSGGDIATWFYYPDGRQGGCPAYDAGNGAFPDVAVDGLLVVPEAGGDP
jgi:hypothetical protein